MSISTPEQQVTESDRLDSMWAQRCATLHKAWVQVRYHRKRQRFFDLLDKGTKSVTVVLGASLMGKFFSSLLPWLATAITSIGLLALVFGYSDRKQQHKELAEQAAKLVADIERVPVASLNFDRTTGWAADYAQLIAKAPPALKSLTIECEHEQAIADGHNVQVPPSNWQNRIADTLIVMALCLLVVMAHELSWI